MAITARGVLVLRIVDSLQWSRARRHRREPAWARAEALEERVLLAAWLDTTDKAAVINWYQTQYLVSNGVPEGWTGSLVTGNPGTTAPAFKDVVLRRVNFYRVLAGVPPVLAMDATYSAKAQAAALMMSANNDLNHSPPSTWTFYTAAGAEAAGKSNIALGANAPLAIDWYMDDGDPSNTRAGHRRWILFPQTQKMGTGDVPGDQAHFPANALWVMDDTKLSARPETRTPYVSWPSPGYVPSELVPLRWSFSYGGATFDTAQVAVWKNGAALSLTYDPLSNGAGENSLVWDMPQGSVQADAQYTVQVTNVKINGLPQTFTYVVRPISVEGLPPIVVTPPAAPSGLAATATTATSVTLGWTLNSTNETRVTVRGWDGGAWILVKSLPAGTTTFTDTGLKAATPYFYDVTAGNSAGETWADAYATATTAKLFPPAAPTALTATVLSSTSVKVTWTLATPDASVVVKRWTGNSWTDAAVLGTGATSVTVKNLPPGTSIHFDVVAVNAQGAAWAANYVTAVMPQAGPPAAATDLSALVQTGPIVALTWTLNSSDETSVWVAKWNGTAWQMVAQLAAGTTRWVDANPHAGENWYEVVTWNRLGWGPLATPFARAVV